MAAITTRTFEVQGMHCSGCADTLSRVLGRIDGVIAASADYEAGRVEVRFDPERVSDDAIREAIRTAGYEPVG